MCHVSRVTYHVSCVTCHVSPVMCQHIFLQSGGASWWRVCYQWGLPHQVLIDSLIHSVTYSSKYSSTKLYSKTARAMELTFLEKVYLPPHDMCQVSHVRCHVSHVTCDLPREQTDYERYTWKAATHSLPNTKHSLPKMEKYALLKEIC